MIPFLVGLMPGRVMLLLGAILLALGASFGAGWKINGDRWAVKYTKAELRHTQELNAQAEAAIAAFNEYRAKEQAWEQQKAQAEAYTPPPMPAPTPAASGGVPWVPVLVTALVVGGGILLVRSQQQTRYPSSYRRVSRE